MVSITLSVFAAKYFVGGFSKFMLIYPLAAWWYIGVESLGFCYNMVKDLHTDIPNGTIACIFTLFFTSIFVLFVTCSLSPAMDLATSASPLNVGNSHIYKISNTMATAIAIPATYATAFGFIFAYGKLICSLSLSKLLPYGLSFTTEDNSQPWSAMIGGSIIGYGICLLAYYDPYIALQLFNICCLSAFSCYISQCVGFILLRTKFSSLKRQFKSPLGIFGAVYSATMFAIGIVAIIGFQGDNCFSFIVFVCLVIGFSIYYYFSASHHQAFCEEEEKLMFTAYVVNASHLKRSKRSSSRGKKAVGSFRNSLASAARAIGLASFLGGESSVHVADSSDEVKSSQNDSSGHTHTDVHIIQGAKNLRTQVK